MYGASGLARRLPVIAIVQEQVQQPAHDANDDRAQKAGQNPVMWNGSFSLPATQLLRRQPGGLPTRRRGQSPIPGHRMGGVKPFPLGAY
jgi:hypothetical protein